MVEVVEIEERGGGGISGWKELGERERSVEGGELMVELSEG